METNKEGLTWPEWFRAVFAFSSPRTMSRYEQRKLRAAWRAGEDPTEWAAHYQKTVKP